MKKTKVQHLLTGAKATLAKRSPQILMGLGIVGMATSTVLAVKATPKALMILEDEKFEKQTDKLTPVETVKATWKCYAPAAVTGAVSVACLFGASAVNHKRNAALAAAYALSETALIEYKDKVVEVIGEEKERVVRERIARDRVEKKPVSKGEVIMTNKGNELCLDYYSGRYFYSNRDAIEHAVNNLNRKMRNENYISLNEFYTEIGMPTTKMGNDLGWNIDRGYIDIEYDAAVAEDGRPCLVIDYNLAPRHDYWR